MKKAKKVYVICAEPGNSSCIVTAVYENRDEALGWVDRQNKKLGFEQYWVEQSQLIQ